MTNATFRTEELRSALQETLDHASAAGATAADGLVVESLALSASVRLSEVEKLTDARKKRLGLRVFVGKRSAIAGTSDLARRSLRRFAVETVELARITAADSLNGLPERTALAAEAPDLDLYDAGATIVAPADALENARAAEQAALACDPRLANSAGAQFSQRASTVAYASTLGFDGGYRLSSFYLGVEPVATANGVMQRDHWYARARHRTDLEDPGSIGRRAAVRTLRRLGARKVKTQEAPVVFEPEVAVSLLGHLAGAVTGQSLYRGTSFLLERLGEAIAAPEVTVIDDGRLLRGHGSRPFDAEGLPTRRNVVIDNGRLASYLLDTYSARRLELQPTGNAMRAVDGAPSASPMNLYLEPGPRTPDEIIASVDRGLLVTELIGFGVNPVTGDYSRGAAGLWIERGEITHAVEEITIAGNLLEMFRDIELIGNDLAFRGNIAAPTIKIARMTIAGA